MKKAIMHLIAHYELHKRRKGNNHKWRIWKATTGTLYVQCREKSRWKYRDVVRVADHLPTNSRGNIKTKQVSTRITYITVLNWKIQYGI